MKCTFRYLLHVAALLGAGVIFSPTDASAQWSSDAGNNLIVSDITGGSTQPKMEPTPDGGFYVSWFSDDGGFDIYLQKLDANGNELWAHNGILVAERDYGFTYDYGLAVDSAGNAFVSFNCCENSSASEHIAVNKITPTGTLPWGAAGVTVSSAAESVYNAYVTSATDGSVVVAWSADSGVRAQKLDADGNALWVDGGIVLTQPPAALKLLGGLEAADNGNVIASWSNQAGSARILYAQKLASADGASLWGNGVRVFGQGNLQAGYYPPFVADGSGGGVFYDYDITGVVFSARVQHIDTDGNLLLGANGVVATTDTTNLHTDTVASFNPGTGDIYVLWRDNFTDNVGHTFDGVSAQRIDSTGNRAWGATGKTLVPLTNSTDSTNAISELIALPTPDGFLASWTTGAIPAANQPITVARLDADGNYVWPAQTVNVKTTGYTARNVGAISANGFAAYAWQDGDDDAGTSTIRAQNLNFDGTLGIPGAVTYSVGGTVSGLSGSGLVLQLNGASDLPIAGDGSFAFGTFLADGSSYAVTVLAQPTSPAQICTVANGTGTIDGANVSSIKVSCSTSAFTIGGTVSGLAGAGLTLQLNGGADLPIAADGSFVFATPIADGSAYTVTVSAQPAQPVQTCTVANGTGTVAGSNVTNVSVTCSTSTYTVGGTVSGLAGSGLVLQMNAGNNLAISADGAFTFTAGIADGSTYVVSVLAQPTNPTQTCTATNASGTIDGANVSNVVVTCATSNDEIFGNGFD